MATIERKSSFFSRNSRNKEKGPVEKENYSLSLKSNMTTNAKGKKSSVIKLMRSRASKLLSRTGTPQYPHSAEIVAQMFIDYHQRLHHSKHAYPEKVIKKETISKGKKSTNKKKKKKSSNKKESSYEEKPAYLKKKYIRVPMKACDEESTSTAYSTKELSEEISYADDTECDEESNECDSSPSDESSDSDSESEDYSCDSDSDSENDSCGSESDAASCDDTSFSSLTNPSSKVEMTLKLFMEKFSCFSGIDRD